MHHDEGERLGRMAIDAVGELLDRFFDQNVSATHEANLGAGPSRLPEILERFNIVKVDLNWFAGDEVRAFEKFCQRRSGDPNFATKLLRMNARGA